MVPWFPLTQREPPRGSPAEHPAHCSETPGSSSRKGGLEVLAAAAVGLGLWG